MSLEKQLATENTEITEEKQMVAINIGFTHQVSKEDMWRRFPLCVLCDLCGLDCSF